MSNAAGLGRIVPLHRPDAIRLERGAPSGVEANLLIVPPVTPHLRTSTDELVPTVAADPGRAGLLRVAESPEARR